jgi:GTP cyclohydrolase II
MFTYLDPNVRRKLVAQGKLQRINQYGARLDPDAAPPEGEPAINLLGPIPLPIHLGSVQSQVQWYASVRSTELSKVEELAGTLRTQGGGAFFSMLASSMAVNSVLIAGDPESWQTPLVRVHSSCLTGDVFGSERCECGPQLAAALDRITQDPAGGMLVYMAGHEGRGIGLWAKAATYLLQDAGENTYQANLLRRRRTAAPFRRQRADAPADQQSKEGARSERPRSLVHHSRQTHRRRRRTQPPLPRRKTPVGPPARRGRPRPPISQSTVPGTNGK